MSSFGGRIASFFDNDSMFGKFMTKCGIVIAANVMFFLFAMPIVTAGASMCGLYRVMLKMLRCDGVINPFKQFWTGFKENFKQATIAWVIALALLAFGCMDYTICRSASGIVGQMQVVFVALGIVWLLVVCYLFPTICAFSNKLTKLVGNALFFALKNPVKAILILLLHIVPAALTYLDTQMQPLFAFVWTFFGFGLIAYLAAKLLLKEFAAFLPEVDEYGDFIADRDV